MTEKRTTHKAPPHEIDTALCRGCDNDFYNGKQNFSTFGCWSLKDAKAVTRYRVPWWTPPLTPGAFTEVKTFNCHSETGRFAFKKQPHPEATGTIKAVTP